MIRYWLRLWFRRSGGQPVRFDAAGRETDGQEREGWVDGLGEDVGAEGDGAERFEHCACEVGEILGVV